LFSPQKKSEKNEMSILTQGHFLIYGYNNFTQKGYKKASKAKDWEDINSFDLTGKAYMVTGLLI
jgi:hypothetical protein